MSNNFSSDDSTKKFQLTDSLLRKVLSNEEFSSVKLIEPAIISVPISKPLRKPGYKHVAISSTKILILNSPAKEESDLLFSFELKEVEKIQLMFDKVDFLQGDLAKNALHIQMKCKNTIVSDENNNLPNDTTEQSVHETPGPIMNKNLTEQTAKLPTKKAINRRPLPRLSNDSNLSASFTHGQGALTLSTSRFQGQMLNQSWNDTLRFEYEKKANKKLLFMQTSPVKSDDQDETFEDIATNSNVDREEGLEGLFEIDLFTVTKSSNMFNIIKMSWESALLYETKNLETEAAKISYSDSLIHKFNQLKDEILQSSDFEDLFMLTKELNYICRKCLVLKKAFWKSESLVQFYLMKMKELLITSYISLHQRMDELDLLLLIGETWITVFHDVELYPSRNDFLNKNCETFTTDLLSYCFKKPFLPMTIQHSELENLLGQWGNMQVEMFNLLINAAKHCQWTCNERNFTTDYLVQTLRKTEYSLMQALHQWIGSIKTMFSSERAISTQETLLLYHSTLVLTFLYANSPYLKQNIGREFREDFKYYIKKSSNVKLIPQNLPISRLLIPMFQQFIDALQV